MYQRTELLCYMLGAIQETKSFVLSNNDALLILDRILNDMKQPSITEEEKQIIDRMSEEMEIFNIQMGLNRATQRKLGLGH